MTYKKKFLIEKDAKNTAYCFILRNGLLEKFAEFCRDYKTADSHTDCIRYLLGE